MRWALRQVFHEILYLATSTWYGCQTGSKTSSIAKQLARVPTTPSCLAAPLELTKKASLLLWLVRGSTTSLFAHLFGNHRPSFKIDNQRLVLTHCFQSSSSTATQRAKKVPKMAGFIPTMERSLWFIKKSTFIDYESGRNATKRLIFVDFTLHLKGILEK